MPERVKTERLLEVMSELGFDSEQIGSHAVLRHVGSDTVVTVPTDRIEVPAIFLATISQQVSNTGIMSADAFRTRITNGLNGFARKHQPAS